jgi:zinc protease
MNAVSASIEDIVTFGLDDRYYDRYAARIRGVTAAQVVDAARRLIEPGRVIWVVVGDRAKVEAGLRELDLGPVTVVDPDGKPVVASTGTQ